MKLSDKLSVTLFSVLAAVFLTAVKFGVGYCTNSLGLLSEALHSGLDVLAAVITLFAVRMADKPADRDHNFGHGKMENFSALIEALILLLTCAWIIHEAARRLASGEVEMEVTIWSYAVVLLAITIDLSRSIALRRMAKKYNSQALEADALHFSSDILSSGVVLVGLICAQLGFTAADSIAGLLVAVVVIVISVRLAKRAIDSLLDKAPPDITVKVEEVLKSDLEVLGYHDLKVRPSGGDYFIAVSIHVNPTLTIEEAHCIADSIEQKITDSIAFNCHSDIHVEPEGHCVARHENR
jgi:cation diffusion facilitator family transporter